ncbi:MAG: UDP-N-acetylmuramoylalanyl-D-glutamyl-2,6-diaminopimelate--D-alanyl-D-alanine ligase [Alphaproteobacteria bacterium]|nr:UDP-N-acetylmuramoylalanyl-D-glutamyl-2,6-diaminopimelate--D-alanyl-D-alanine ligase [Alphaproteobacteria bacterium]
MNARATLWSAQEAVAATGGKSTRDWNAFGISIDTRTLETGDLFVALSGENRDGHDFVAGALAKGAAAALVNRRSQDVPADAALLIVADTQKGLEALGRAARARSKARIVAVTGSAGKTTTKEMLRLMLARAGSVAASAASYNNHFGVPLSLARMGRDASFGVFEIGMNHEGEIRSLVAQVRPHVAIITIVAPGHLEYFGTVEKIADAKAEIFEGLEPGGVAILPADNPQFPRLEARARALGVSTILTFGTRDGADARLVFARSTANGQDVIAGIGGEKIAFAIGAAGTHVAMNAIAALLAARALGVSVKDAAPGLEGFTALKGRGARLTLSGIDIIDESYNANPASMAAALQLLGASAPREGGRRIAVLGDMLELGVEGPKLHRQLAKDIADARADLVFLSGSLMEALWEALPPRHRGAYAEKSSALAPEIVASVRAGDVLLIKGSFGSRMSVVIDALRARVAAPA